MKSAWIVIPLATMVSWLICIFLIRAGGRFMDHPNERSLHEKPVPKGGGLGILAGLVLSTILLHLLSNELLWVAGLALILGGFSFLDDLYHLSPLIRFLVQGLLAGILLTQVGWPNELPLPGGPVWPTVIGIIFGWLFVVWMTNLYNFMDGMDGFAGGMTVFGFAALALLGWLGGDSDFAVLCAAIAAAAIGFLWFNFPPARLFMGDVGSASLGFLVAGLILYAHRQKVFPLWVGAMVFFPFILDATITLARRLLHGEQVWQPHCSHYYQRLVRMGWGHRKTVLWEYGIMALCVLAALCAVRRDVAGQWAVLMAVLLVHISAMAWIDVRERQEDAIYEGRRKEPS